MIISSRTTIATILRQASKLQASDVYMVVGHPPSYRVSKEIHPSPLPANTREDILQYIKELLPDALRLRLEKTLDVDAGCTLDTGERFRLTLFWERNQPGFSARFIPARIPTLDDLRAPQAVGGLLERKNGLVLVTGPSGSGKSTLLAAMIEEINQTRNALICTLEDPIEFLFKTSQSTIVQRQLGEDFLTFGQGIKSALRQNMDVILVGEIRDLETMAATLTLAETGHLVLATLHTNNASETVERIVDVFPGDQQHQVRMQLAHALRGIVSKVLVPHLNGSLVAAYEMLLNNPAVGSLIRESKTTQIPDVLHTSASQGMFTMDQDLYNLVQDGLISEDVALSYAVNPKWMKDMDGMAV